MSTTELLQVLDLLHKGGALLVAALSLVTLLVFLVFFVQEFRSRRQERKSRVRPLAMRGRKDDSGE